ncbi:MAG: serine/threonine protein phosphatase [Paenibacillaceae bacterium]|nr:serine/threonine protein phosphatase [Paenibacillaceae bacterium]
MKFFMTDIHGEYKGMELLLKQARVDYSKDRLIVGGDMINRGKESAKVVRKLRKLAAAHPDRVQVLGGNHEEMVRDYYGSGDKLWLSHGGRETLKDFEKTFSKTEMEEQIQWLCNLPLIYEDEEFVYTHAGLNPSEPLDKQSREILWMTEAEFYTISRESLLALTHSKPVVHGHTPVERIYYDGVRLNGDLGSHTYSVREERGLALVNLTRMTYSVYKQHSGRIEERRIIRF